MLEAAPYLYPHQIVVLSVDARSSLGKLICPLNKQLSN